MIKIIKIKSKSIFAKTGIPGASYVINQYVGCQHACFYCYAKFMCRWKPYGEWGSWIEVKENAPELVKNRFVKGCVYMSSISDPYQPMEKELELTRAILENLNKNIELSIQTKSNLVLRDIDILKKFKRIEVGLTINGFEDSIKKIFEPFSCSNEERIETLQILKEKKIKTYGFISPIIPDLMNIKEVIEKSKKAVDFYWFELLNLKAAGQAFDDVLQKQFPQSYEIMRDRKKFYQFVKEIRTIIKKENIKSAGIVIHYPKFKVIK